VSDDGFKGSIILRLLADIDLSEGDSGRAMKRYQVALISNVVQLSRLEALLTDEYLNIHCGVEFQ